MILVDSSVLIDYLAGTATAATVKLDQVIGQGKAYALTPIVIQEVLQGARDARQWRRLDTYLSAQLLLIPDEPLDLHRQAARIYFDLRRSGLTVRSTVDCVIAQIALTFGAALLHSDRDFDTISKVRPLRMA